ncbi:MAG TPA: class I SAM-dependent methyltransferase [Acidiferrobacterales bacterium]|nr:class I SAM-dependent methyltransferase [Acidiferrobacterales bacterium]
MNASAVVDVIQKYLFYLFVRAKRLHPYSFSPAHRKRNRFVAETVKARRRRLREGFFERYCRGTGIDIGCGKYDRVTIEAEEWNRENGDATFMEGVPNESYDYVYSSHCLEHIIDQTTALQNWARILKKGGFLIVAVPHRDLYEKRIVLPSLWNKDHKRFYLPDQAFPPDTFSFRKVVQEAIGDQVEWIYLKVCDEGWLPLPDRVHPVGEYQIEAVLKKK